MENDAVRQADVLLGKYIVEVKHGMHSIRNLRASLIELTYRLKTEPRNYALLVLVDSRITMERLSRELKKAANVIRPELMGRLQVVRVNDGTYEILPQNLADEYVDLLSGLVSREKSFVKSRDSFYVVLEVILFQYLNGSMPVTRKLLMDLTGFSYPTVAVALKRLKPYLVDLSDRRIGLKYFPREEWARLQAVSEKVRSTKRYAAPQGMSRSYEQHLSRLVKTGQGNIAIGGVQGARHYYPDLDLVGVPRLDLSIHSHGGRPDLRFIRELDPALEPVKDSLQPVDVAVHIIGRKESLFTLREDGLPWADPVECMMDLHEAGLTRQADEFLEYMERRRTEGR